MRKSTTGLLSIFFFCCIACSGTAQRGERRISAEEYRDKMAAGWIGQMVGVGWGAPTEFRYMGEIIPEENVPVWEPEMVNQFRQDDLYVEMTFLRSTELHGFDVSMRQAGIDFANSGYGLAHANRFGRKNLREGIAPPDSGHPKFNIHADDIDYQIEADFSGLIAPGMPNVGIALGEKFGRLMNYGDGLYGGQFVAGMYAEAFFEKEPKKIVEAGLACIPRESQYAECIRDVLRWHAEAPDDWQAVWRRIDKKYQRDEAYRRFSCGREKGAIIPLERGFNIDAKINGAYIVMGLLYGEGDMEKTNIISMRCGLDSDCNPSSAAGILFTATGARHLPSQYVSKLDRTIKFSHTAYNFDELLEVCEKLARQAVLRQGGRIEKNASGDEVFVIPVAAARPSALEQSWEPGPIAHSRFTEDEQAKITRLPPREALIRDMERFAPGWRIEGCVLDSAAGIRERNGKFVTFFTLPIDPEAPCIISKRAAIPRGKHTALELTVRSHRKGDFELVVLADQSELLRKVVDFSKSRDLTIDLTPYAGKTIYLEVWNLANGWEFEFAYWNKIKIESK